MADASTTEASAFFAVCRTGGRQPYGNGRLPPGTAAVLTTPASDGQDGGRIAAQFFSPD